MIDSSDLKLSGLYFAAIQILRIAAEWIQESMDELQSTVEDMERLYLSSDLQDATIESFKQNWDSVISRQQRVGVALLARVTRYQVEVESLRDGVSVPTFKFLPVLPYAPSKNLTGFMLTIATAVCWCLSNSYSTRHQSTKQLRLGS